MPRLARGLGRQKFGIGQVVPRKTIEPPSPHIFQCNVFQNNVFQGVCVAPDIVIVTNGSVTVTGKTVNILNVEVIPVLKASVTFTGKTVTILDRDVIPVLKASVTFAGKTVTILDRDVVPVLKATVTFAGQTVTIVNLAATQVIPVGKGDVLFAGQPIIITDTGVSVGLPGGGGFSVPPYIDYGRKKRRRYRALEEIEKRIDERIERLTAETRVTQEKIQTVFGSGQTEFGLGQAGSQEYEHLLRRQAQVTQMLHEAQRRAERVRQERIELAQLARLAAEAADEEEAITMLLLT